MEQGENNAVALSYAWKRLVCRITLQMNVCFTLNIKENTFA